MSSSTSDNNSNNKTTKIILAAATTVAAAGAIYYFFLSSSSKNKKPSIDDDEESSFGRKNRPPTTEKTSNTTNAQQMQQRGSPSSSAAAKNNNNSNENVFETTGNNKNLPTPLFSKHIPRYPTVGLIPVPERTKDQGATDYSAMSSPEAATDNIMKKMNKRLMEERCDSFLCDKLGLFVNLSTVSWAPNEPSGTFLPKQDGSDLLVEEIPLMHKEWVGLAETFEKVSSDKMLLAIFSGEFPRACCTIKHNDCAMTLDELIEKTTNEHLNIGEKNRWVRRMVDTNEDIIKRAKAEGIVVKKAEVIEKTYFVAYDQNKKNNIAGANSSSSPKKYLGLISAKVVVRHTFENGLSRDVCTYFIDAFNGNRRFFIPSFEMQTNLYPDKNYLESFEDMIARFRVVDETSNNIINRFSIEDHFQFSFEKNDSSSVKGTYCLPTYLSRIVASSDEGKAAIDRVFSEESCIVRSDSSSSHQILAVFQSMSKFGETFVIMSGEPEIKQDKVESISSSSLGDEYFLKSSDSSLSSVQIFKSNKELNLTLVSCPTPRKYSIINDKALRRIINSCKLVSSSSPEKENIAVCNFQREGISIDLNKFNFDDLKQKYFGAATKNTNHSPIILSPEVSDDMIISPFTSLQSCRKNHVRDVARIVTTYPDSDHNNNNNNNKTNSEEEEEEETPFVIWVQSPPQGSGEEGERVFSNLDNLKENFTKFNSDLAEKLAATDRDSIYNVCIEPFATGPKDFVTNDTKFFELKSRVFNFPPSQKSLEKLLGNSEDLGRTPKEACNNNVFLQGRITSIGNADSPTAIRDFRCFFFQFLYTEKFLKKVGGQQVVDAAIDSFMSSITFYDSDAFFKAVTWPQLEINRFLAPCLLAEAELRGTLPAQSLYGILFSQFQHDQGLLAHAVQALERIGRRIVQRIAEGKGSDAVNTKDKADDAWRRVFLNSDDLSEFVVAMKTKLLA